MRASAMVSSPLKRRVCVLLAAAAASAAVLLHGDAQEQHEQPPAQPTFRLEANFVRVDVYPTAGGKAVRDLTAADFEVLEDGVPQRIETFEHLEIRGGGTESGREPNSVQEGRAMAENPRSRVFIVFLDTYHTGIAGSHRMQGAIVELLDRILGSDDLFAVMTPEMSVTDLALARRTTTTAGMLAKYWYWGRRDSKVQLDPEEQMYEICFPEHGSAKTCRDPTSPGGTGVTSQPDDTYKGVAKEMIARRREKRVLDALTDLTVFLRGLREERKAVLAISDGWLLFRENQTLTRIGVCDTPRSMGQIGVGPDGRLTTDTEKSQGYGSQAQCERDRQNLSRLDNWQTFHDLLDRANRANVSFYPIDSRGLPVFDTQIEDDVLPHVDQRMLLDRIETLRTLADATDGMAVVNNNDIERGMRRIVDDLTSYYLLGYYSTNRKLDGQFRSIKVRVKRSGVDVRARRGYRAATEAEILQGQQMTAAAQSAAPSSALQAALTSLAGIRPEITLRTDVSWIAAPIDDSVPGAKSHVWVVGEIEAASAKSPEWANGGEAEVLLTAEDGVKLADVTERIEPAARTVTVQLPDVPLAPGEFTLRLRLRPAGGGLPFQDTFRFTVPEETTTIGHARVSRRGPSTGTQYVPTADRRFRRTDRVRVEVPVLGGVESASAELLDRKGSTLPIPVESSRRDGDSAALQWVTAEVALAPLAPGDYVVKTSIKQGTATKESLTALRIVP